MHLDAVLKDQSPYATEFFPSCKTVLCSFYWAVASCNWIKVTDLDTPTASVKRQVPSYTNHNEYIFFRCWFQTKIFIDHLQNMSCTYQYNH